MRDYIQKHLNAAPMGFIDKSLELLRGAQRGIELVRFNHRILRPYVVEVVGITQGIASQPYTSDAQFFEVGQFGLEAREGSTLRPSRRCESLSCNLVNDEILHPFR